jgi:tRNA threonylcarbamoyladenosine biosynthesis protein TsaE
MKKTIKISSLQEVPHAAHQVLHSIGNHKIVAFYGAMGVGKTTLIKALCNVLGVSDQVGSPTFTLVNEYKTAEGLMVYHFDFYRIKKIEEAYDLGCDEYFNSEGFCFIEWPELIEELLPQDVVRLSIRELPQGVREIFFA